MHKKIIAFTGALALTLSMGTTAFAAPAPAARASQNQAYGCGRGMMNGGGYGFMMDEDGNLLSRKDFEDKLDKAIKDGTIDTEDKDFYLQMYENCVNGNGNGCGGGRRGCSRF